MGGSPCTHWSIAQKNNRETTAEGLGWELFKNYLIAKEKYNPDFFLYENNKSAAPAIKDQISCELGEPLQYINSSLLSAQKRDRFYCHNIPKVVLPQDKKIILKDILESGCVDREKSYCLKHQAGNTRDYFKKHHTQIVFEYVSPLERIGDIDTTVDAHRVHSPYDKSGTIKASAIGQDVKTGLYLAPIPENLVGKVCDQGLIYKIENCQIETKHGNFHVALPNGCYIIRKLTVLECKRLQTVPDNFIMPCSASQNYKMLGNGWTVDVIAHILSYIPGVENEEVEVLSMYDGMSCGHIALDKLSVNVKKYYATEIDKYAIQTTMTNFPNTIQLGDAFQVRERDWKIS